MKAKINHNGTIIELEGTYEEIQKVLAGIVTPNYNFFPNIPTYPYTEPYITYQIETTCKKSNTY